MSLDTAWRNESLYNRSLREKTLPINSFFCFIKTKDSVKINYINQDLKTNSRTIEYGKSKKLIDIISGDKKNTNNVLNNKQPRNLSILITI